MFQVGEMVVQTETQGMNNAKEFFKFRKKRKVSNSGKYPVFITKDNFNFRRNIKNWLKFTRLRLSKSNHTIITFITSS